MVQAAAEGRPVTEAILATGRNRRPSLGLAAAVAVEAATLTGAGTLLLEVGEGAQRRGPTMLAAPAARRLEEALRPAGFRASARGHLCHLAVPNPAEDLADLGQAVETSGAELAVVHLPGRLWVPALDGASAHRTARALGRPRLIGGCLLVSLPGERSLAALAVEELGRRRLPARVVTEAPSTLASRRALAGVRPGGRSPERAPAAPSPRQREGSSRGCFAWTGRESPSAPVEADAGRRCPLCSGPV